LGSNVEGWGHEWADAGTRPLYHPGYDVKLHPVTKAQFSTIEVLVAMLMTRWEFMIVPCPAGGNAFAHEPYKCQVIIITD